MRNECRWPTLSFSLVLAAALGLSSCGKPHVAAKPYVAAKPPSAPASLADPADAAAAKAFLDGLYAHYRTSKDNDFQMFDADAAKVFDPRMLALLKADTAVLKGELGAIDGDWLCDCQDFVSVRAGVKVTSATSTHATATAAIVDLGIPEQAARHNLFDLDKVGGAWRIHDIQETGQPSLRRMLEDEVKHGPQP